MIRAPLAALLALSLTCVSATNCMGGYIVYNIVNYADLNNGSTLSGTITTDGTIGTLTSADITAWSFSVTGPTSYQVTSQNPDASILVANLAASATELTLPFPPLSSPPNTSNALVLRNNNDTPDLEYLRETAGGNPFDQYGSQTGTLPIYAWIDFSRYPPGLSLGGSTWIIATAAAVPGPGALTLALLGGACIGAVQWMRRCRRAVSRSDR